MIRKIFTFLICLSTVSVFAQLKQNAKLNVTSLLGWRIVEGQYEYAFHSKLSFQLGAAFRIPSNFGLTRILPDQELGIGETDPFEELRYSGFRITPEIKFYPGNNKEAPQGFYLAGYARYYNYSLQTGTFTADLDGTLEEADARFSISSLTFGAGIGTQWIINDRFTIDVMWFGFSIGSGNIDVILSADNANIDWEQAARDAEVDVDFADAENIEALDDGIRARFRNPFAFGLRSSLSFGLAF